MTRRNEVLYFEATPAIKNWLMKAAMNKLVTLDEVICELVETAMAGGAPQKAKPEKKAVTPDGSLLVVGTDDGDMRGPTKVFRRMKKAAPPAPKRPRKRVKKVAKVAKAAKTTKAASDKAAPKAKTVAKPAKATAKKAVKKVAKKAAPRKSANIN